jgi:hypothetical protein
VKGVRTRRSRRIERGDATRWSGIPTTTVARTLVDLAAVLPIDDLARACHEAGVRYGTTPRGVEAVLARHPRTNRPAGGRRVDCRWREQRLTVELDSYRYHHSRHAWEQDRRREREARARGDEFRRYTWSDVFEQPKPMLTELRALLGPAPGPHRGRSGSS